jgi:NAD(P)-dependent dehydrogenase (short-subunit alcohol dehydrogenase family)
LQIDLAGQRILVTGASRGIGRALAVGLGRAGADVAVHYHQNEAKAREVCEAIGETARSVRADLAEAPEAGRLFERAVEALGGLDALVNNAGVAVEAPLEGDEAFWTEAWDRTLDVNLRATALLCRAALLHFRKTGNGRIINVASRAAFRGDTPDYLAYAASKGGMVALTRSIARGFGPEGVKAFLVAPGYVRTDMALQYIEEYGEESTIGDIPLGRMAEPEDLAPLVVLLASGLADHATGSTFDVNGASYVH